jgi:hypothetical protein
VDSDNPRRGVPAYAHRPDMKRSRSLFSGF